MTPIPRGADERRVRAWLHARLDSRRAPAEPVTPTEPAAPAPALADDGDLPTEPPPGDQTAAPPPWWSVDKTGCGEEVAEQPVAEPVQLPGGIHVTINQPGPAAEEPGAARDRARRARIRRFIAYHGSAAAAGWYFGLEHSMAAMLAHAGNGGVAVGLGLILVTTIPAHFLPLAWVPPGLRPAAAWLLRIPGATAALALALNAPHALI